MATPPKNAGMDAPEATKAPAIEYTAQVASSLVNGEAKLTVGEDALMVTALFDAVEIPYADIRALVFADYTVTLRTADGNLSFSRMGRWAQPFYGALYAAYNQKVKKALFVSGSPLLTASGTCQYTENGQTVQCLAPVEVYETCVCVLPPDENARRIPLCFANGLEKSEYSVTLRLLTGEVYTFGKLGYDTAPFANIIETQIRSLREKSLAAIAELDPSLRAVQTAQLAKCLPPGAAAPFGLLTGIAPSFVAALEIQLNNSRAAETFRIFRTRCNPEKIYVGFKKNTPDSGIAGNPLAALGGGNPLGTAGENPLGIPSGSLNGAAKAQEEALPPDPYTLYLIAPSPYGGACAVEFAGDPDDAAATFVFRTRDPRTSAGYSFDDEFAYFAHRLYRALEAIDFKREVLRLSDDELRKPAYAHYRMAVQRNSALRFVRACLVGRVIHNSAWQCKLEELFAASAPMQAPQNPPAQAYFCSGCGAKLPQGVLACAACGKPAKR